MRAACLLSGGVLGACSLGNFSAKHFEQVAARLGYKQGYELAVWQDSLLVRYGRGERIPDAELKELRNNPWVGTAKDVAPGNLVLRQWALEDLFSGTPRNAERILEMSELLAGVDFAEGAYAPVSPGALWLEGYSYWTYTRRALEPWSIRFAGREESVRLRSLMDAVDRCFAATAYAREGVWYPAPFGDVRDLPLEEPAATLRRAMPSGPAGCAFVEAEIFEDTVRYRITARPVGMNTHVPHEPSRVTVRAGRPEDFPFYQGYARKYSDSTSELKDMLRPERLRSVRVLKLRERFAE